MTSDIQKTIAGALLLGASLLSGNALLITVAGGVGVNWTSEGLGGLWGQAAQLFTPDTPLAHAGERAIRRAAEGLRRAYRQEYGAAANTRAFDLVRDCAGAVVAAPAMAPHAPLEAQQALAPALDALLHGHEERQVTFLTQRLLGAVGTTFHDELAVDQAAWRSYHGWLIAQLTARTGSLQQALASVPQVLARLTDQAQALQALDDAVAALQAQIAALQAAIMRLAAGQGAGSTTFRNRDMAIGGDLDQAGGDVQRGGRAATPARESSAPRGTTEFVNQGVTVTGNVTQAGGSIYDHSAHVTDGGSATVINGAPPAWATSAAAPPVALHDPRPLGQRIGDGYDGVGLLSFCQAHFPAVASQHLPDMQKERMVQLLIDYCRAIGQGARLLDLLEQERPGLIGADRAALLAWLASAD